jgi:hypothetical protein
MPIKPSSDRKTRAYAAEKNTFGLLPGPDNSCPGATTEPGGCAHVPEGRKLPDCYVFKLMKCYGGVAKILQHNSDLLMNSTYQVRYELFKEEFQRFLDAHRKRKRAHQPMYRIHWSGDCPDETYARALRAAMDEFPEIKFWGYTRSWFSVAVMAGSPNCDWYLSLDEVNFADGYAEFLKWEHNPAVSNISWAYMGKEKPVGSWATQMASCPVDLGKMEVEGACQKCQLCMAGSSIYFKS